MSVENLFNYSKPKIHLVNSSKGISASESRTKAIHLSGANFYGVVTMREMYLTWLSAIKRVKWEKAFKPATWNPWKKIVKHLMWCWNRDGVSGEGWRICKTCLNPSHPVTRAWHLITSPFNFFVFPLSFFSQDSRCVFLDTWSSSTCFLNIASRRPPLVRFIGCLHTNFSHSLSRVTDLKFTFLLLAHFKNRKLMKLHKS